MDHELYHLRIPLVLKHILIQSEFFQCQILQNYESQPSTLEKTFDAALYSNYAFEGGEEVIGHADFVA